jgi:hypothetical protein
MGLAGAEGDLDRPGDEVALALADRRLEEARDPVPDGWGSQLFRGDREVAPAGGEDVEGAAAGPRAARPRGGLFSTGGDLHGGPFEADTAPRLGIPGAPRLRRPDDPLEGDALAGGVLDEQHLPFRPEVLRHPADSRVEREPQEADRRHRLARHALPGLVHGIRVLLENVPTLREVVEEPGRGRGGRRRDGECREDPREESPGMRPRARIHERRIVASRDRASRGRGPSWREEGP